MAVRILVVTQYFYPEQFRINDICMEWVKRGYEVTVVTGIPNYPQGKTYEGYGLTKKRSEFWNGIRIIRLPLIPRGSGAIGMIANYLSFMITGMIAGKTKRIEADFVFSFEVSPMTQVMTGVSFAKRLKIPHYLYVQDLWPENVITVTGITNPLVIKPINKMVDHIYRHTDHIFATSPSFVKAICEREVPVAPDKVHYWPQYAEEFYQPKERQEIPELSGVEGFRVVFTGNIGTAQGLQILPKTAQRLKDPGFVFVIVGDGRYLPELQNEVREAGLSSQFVFIPRQPAERIPEILAACDAAFVSFQNDELWLKTIPAKLQSYMACGMPIIASADGETARVIDEAQCGLHSPVGDVDALADALIAIRKMDLPMLGNNGRSYFENCFSKKKLMDELDQYFKREKTADAYSDD